MPGMIGIARRNHKAHIGHWDSEQPLLRRLFSQNEPDLGLILRSRFAVGGVVHLEHQVGSGGDQLGGAMVLVKIFPVYARHVAQQPFVTLISWRRRIPRLAVRWYIGFTRLRVLHPLRSGRTNVHARMVDHRSIARANLAVDHPGVFGEPAGDNEVSVFHRSGGGNRIRLGDFEYDIGLDVPTLMPLDWGGFVLRITLRSSSVHPG